MSASEGASANSADGNLIRITVIALILIYEIPAVIIFIEYFRTDQFSFQSQMVETIASGNQPVTSIDLLHRILIAFLSGISILTYRDKIGSLITIVLVISMIIFIGCLVFMGIILSGDIARQNLAGFNISSQPLIDLSERVLNGTLTYLGVIFGVSLKNSRAG